MENQKESLMAYQDFSNLLSKDINGDPIYPDNYAGEYIDENGDLVFCLLIVALPKIPIIDLFFSNTPVVLKKKRLLIQLINWSSIRNLFRGYIMTV